MYYVYVLRSIKDGKYYTGLTNNFDRRFTEHNFGENQSTKNRGPFVVIFVELVEDRAAARNLEKFLKSGDGREVIKEIDESLKVYSPVAQW